MRILSVATSDRGGGAEQVAWDLFIGLEALGHESYLAVGEKHSSHPRVFEIHQSPWFDYRAFSNPLLQKRWELRRAWSVFRGHEDFDHPYTVYLAAMLPEPPDAIVAHNLHGGYFDLRALPGLSSVRPFVVVLHDYWMLTGHCAYPFSCERWRQGCGNCPDLKIPPKVSRDATRFNHTLKRSIYERSSLVVTSPSRRLLREMEESILFERAREIVWIPNGVDRNCFFPGDRGTARERLGLPKEIPLILMVGKEIEKNPFKNFACALECANRLAAEGRRLMFIFLGASERSDRQIGNVSIRSISFSSDRETVADYYRACDLLLHATRQEVAPLVLSEALACGLPAVASDVGNTADLLGDAGITVPPDDASAHAAALAQLLDNAEERREMGKRAHSRAGKYGSRDQMVIEYEKLLIKLTGKSPSSYRIPFTNKSTMLGDTDPLITLIYPGIDVRGSIAERLRAWIKGQTLPKSLYRVIVVIAPGTGDEESVRSELGPGDSLIHESRDSDIALWNAGAAAATTPWIVFAEGHSPGHPECLEALDRWLRSDPSAAVGNFSITHRGDYMMARRSERWFGEQQSRWRSEWPRFHRAGFAIRREIFHKLGGFQEFGQFGPPLLSARLNAAGYEVELVPGAKVLHIDDERVHDHHFDTIDFVVGECRARSVSDPVFFERYFGQNDLLRNRLINDPHIARDTILAACRFIRTERRMPRALLKGMLQRVSEAVISLRHRVELSEAVTGIEETVLQYTEFLGELHYRWFVRAHQRVVNARAVRWILEESDSESGGMTPGRHSVETLGPEVLGGVHGLEVHQEHHFRWTGQCLRLRISSEAAVQEIRIETGGLRGSPGEPVVLAACGSHPLPDHSRGLSADGNTLIIAIPPSFQERLSKHGLTVIFDPLIPAHYGSTDTRRLGIPIFAVEIRG